MSSTKRKIEQSGRTWPAMIPAQRGSTRHSVTGRQQTYVLPIAAYALALAGLWAALLPWITGAPVGAAAAVSGATIAIGGLLAGRLHEQRRPKTGHRPSRTVALAVLWLAIGALAAYLTHLPGGAA